MLAILAAMNLPVGVIEPYKWRTEAIPVHGQGAPGMESVDAAVTATMKRYGIVGCGVCLTKGDQVLYCKGFGYQELPDKPFLETTASRCGSLAKSITALCALVLMDEGKLKLDDKVVPLLAKVGIVPRPIDARVNQITVRELMDHTSGLPSGATYTSWRPNRNLIEVLNLKAKPTSTEVVADALSNYPLDTDPGTAYQYANANFVLLARVVEAASRKKFNDFLTKVAMPKFGVRPYEIFVSRDQISPEDPARGKTEAAYYQTSSERYCSFLPADASSGQVFGEAYRGYSTECADGAGGIAISVSGLAKILTNLRSTHPALSPQALKEIGTPPEHYLARSDFDPKKSEYYSKGFVVRLSEGTLVYAHGGMTNHCGGVIGFNRGYQFAAVSNWNSAKSPFVDTYLSRVLTRAIAKLEN